MLTLRPVDAIIDVNFNFTEGRTMDIVQIVFSPTGGTQRAADIMTEGCPIPPRHRFHGIRRPHQQRQFLDPSCRLLLPVPVLPVRLYVELIDFSHRAGFFSGQCGHGDQGPVYLPRRLRTPYHTSHGFSPYAHVCLRKFASYGKNPDEFAARKGRKAPKPRESALPQNRIL